MSELPPLTPPDREGLASVNLSTPEGLKQFTDSFIENLGKGKDMDRFRYFQDLLILDAEGILKQDQGLQAVVIKSGQKPSIWEGVYRGAEASIQVLQDEMTSPAQKQAARQTLKNYFRIAEITRMDIPPNYQNPAVQQKIYPVWEAAWSDLNYWRTSLQAEVTPERPSSPTEPQPTPENRAALKQLFDLYRDIQRRLNQGENVPDEEFNALDRQISDTLNLPPDSSFETLEREYQKNYELSLYPTASSEALIAFLDANPQLFRRIFTLYIKESVERVKRWQPDNPEYARDAQQLEQIINHDAHITDDEIKEVDQAKELFDSLDRRFWNLIAQEPPVIIESLIGVFVRRNRTFGQAIRLSNQILQKKADLFSRRAQEAGLKVVGFDENGQIRLEKAST